MRVYVFGTRDQELGIGGWGLKISFHGQEFKVQVIQFRLYTSGLRVYISSKSD